MGCNVGCHWEGTPVSRFLNIVVIIGLSSHLRDFVWCSLALCSSFPLVSSIAKFSRQNVPWSLPPTFWNRDHDCDWLWLWAFSHVGLLLAILLLIMLGQGCKRALVVAYSCGYWPNVHVPVLIITSSVTETYDMLITCISFLPADWVIQITFIINPVQIACTISEITIMI